MAIKTVTITEQAYNKIKRLKKENESFSDLFTRIAEEKLNVASRFLGLAKLSEKELNEWRKNLAENKRAFSFDFEKSQRKLQKRMRELGI